MFKEPNVRIEWHGSEFTIKEDFVSVCIGLIVNLFIDPWGIGSVRLCILIVSVGLNSHNS